MTGRRWTADKLRVKMVGDAIFRPGSLWKKGSAAKNSVPSGLLFCEYR